MGAGRLVGKISFRDATLAGLAGGYGNIGYMGPGLALAVLGAKASAPTALIFCCDSIFLFSIVPFLIALTDHSEHHWLHALGLLVKQIVLNPLIMSACAGALAAAFHFHPPVAIDNTLSFLQNAAAPMALFVLGVTVALRPFGRVPWEVPAVVAVKLLVHPLIVFALMLLLGPFPNSWAATAGVDGLAATGAECLCDCASERSLDRTRVGCGDDWNICFRHHADDGDVDHSERTAGVSVTLLTAWGVRQDGANPSRMASRRSGPNEPIRCNPAARSDCIGRNALNNERFAISTMNVRLTTSARRAAA